MLEVKIPNNICRLSINITLIIGLSFNFLQCQPSFRGLLAFYNGKNNT